MAGVVLYPGVGEGVLYAEEVKDLEATPDAFDVVEETVGGPIAAGGIEQERGEAYVHTLIVGQAEGVLV